MISVIGGRPAG